MSQARTGPFGPEGEFGQRVDEWMDQAGEALFLVQMVRKYPAIFTEAFKASLRLPARREETPKR